MTNKILTKLLDKLGACSDAQEWVGERDLATAWQECERTDWLLWICGHMVGKRGWPTRQEIVLAACACARTALVHVPKGETRPLAAIETAERWVRGDVTLYEVREAAALV